MGRVIKKKASEIIPTFPCLEPQLLFRVFHGIMNGDEIPLSPLRRIVDKDYILDGHHGAVMADLFDLKRPYFVANSEDDLMDKSLFSNLPVKVVERMNRNIIENWNLPTNKKYMKDMPVSITELRNRYGFLRDVKTAQRYFEGNGWMTDAKIHVAS